MLSGKIGKALKFINNDEDATTGIHPLDDRVIKGLEEKHPQPGSVNPDVLLDRSAIDTPEPVIFEPLLGPVDHPCKKVKRTCPRKAKKVKQK